MSTESLLHARSESKCELCGATENLSVMEVPPHSGGGADHCVLVCGVCSSQIQNPDEVDVHHWRCLSDSMWNQEPAVQVMVWRMLNGLSAESWARDLMEMLYLDEETTAWAQSGVHGAGGLKHVDSNGTQLQAGDTVTLIKSLKVKGGNFTAKRGEVVRGISLDPDNAEHIEGRVNGQHIVILTKYVKKSN